MNPIEVVNSNGSGSLTTDVMQDVVNPPSVSAPSDNENAESTGVSPNGVVNADIGGDKADVMQDVLNPPSASAQSNVNASLNTGTETLYNVNSDIATNTIVNLSTLRKVINPHLKKCEICKKGKLELIESSRVGIASTMKLDCSECKSIEHKAKCRDQYLVKEINASSDYVDSRKKKRQLQQRKRRKGKKKQKIADTIQVISLPSTYEKDRKGHRPRTIDFQCNIRCILSSFYTGTAGLDIANMLAMNGIKGGKSWERSFNRSSPFIASKIRNVVKRVIKDALIDEINATVKEKLEGKYDDEKINNLLHTYHTTGVVPNEIGDIRIAVSFDMGWQKKGTGHNYDSNSGHAYLIGCRTGKVVGMLVYSKKCAKCDTITKYGLPEEEHDCPYNYRSGSSKAMEASAALELVIALWNSSNRTVGIEFIVSDDDSTMRAHLQHACNHKHGKLPIDIAEPSFLADPSHRIKVMCKEVFKLALQSKQSSGCELIDALRLKKYIGCFVYKNRHLPPEKFAAKAMAPIEHLFDCHEWCDPEWCYAKEIENRVDTLLTSKKSMCIPCPTTDNDAASNGGENNDNTDDAESEAADDVNSNDDDDSAFNSDACSLPSDATEEEYDTDDNDKMCFFTTLPDDELENVVFADTDLDALKEKEKNLREKKANKYYRNKERDAKLYSQLRECYSPHITVEKLTMLCHVWNTQTNEAMNTSVASYAPKTKTFCKTKSLETRVGIAAGIMIVGYEKLWRMIYDELGLEMDNDLIHSLRLRDSKKNRKAAGQKTKSGKRKRREGEYARNKEKHAAQMYDMKTGKTYGAGIAMKAAKKTASKETSAAARNPEGTPLLEWKCPYYHPNYCTTLGHKGAASKHCAMKGKSKEELAVIKNEILKEAVEKALSSSTKGEYIIAKIFRNFFSKVDTKSVLIIRNRSHSITIDQKDFRTDR